MIEVKELSGGYPGTEVVHDISLSFPAHQRTVAQHKGNFFPENQHSLLILLRISLHQLFKDCPDHLLQVDGLFDRLNLGQAGILQKLIDECGRVAANFTDIQDQRKAIRIDLPAVILKENTRIPIDRPHRGFNLVRERKIQCLKIGPRPLYETGAIFCFCFGPAVIHTTPTPNVSFFPSSHRWNKSESCSAPDSPAAGAKESGSSARDQTPA